MADLPELGDEELMLYLDGELPPGEARDVERALQGSPAARARVEALAQLREVIQARVAAAEDEAEPRLEAMWGVLRAGLAPPPRGLWQRAREWFDSYRSHVFTGAIAAAAGALLATLVGGGQPASRPAGGGRTTAAAAEVESVEVPDGSAMVFQIPNEGAEAPTTVIWVTADTQQQQQGEGPI